MEPDGARGLSADQELSLLRVEYERMAAEIRMYEEQQAPKFTIFSMFVLAAIAFAWGKPANPEFAFVYPIVPYFVFVVGGFATAQAFVMTCCAERIRQIEERVRKLNGGELVLRWETNMASRLIYQLWLKVPYEGGGFFQGLNPVFGAVVLTIIAVIPVVVYCLVKSWYLMPYPWDYVYVIFTLILFAVVLWYATSFFRLGKEIGGLHYSTASDSDEAGKARSGESKEIR